MPSVSPANPVVDAVNIATTPLPEAKQPSGDQVTPASPLPEEVVEEVVEKVVEEAEEVDPKLSTTSTTISTTPIAPEIDEEEEELRTRLRHRRLEIDHEIDEFKQRREAEYRRFEVSLRAEAKAKRKARKQQEQQLDHTLVSPSPSSSPPTPPAVTDSAPPFDRELQVAGLFAPCYLPLLEDRQRDSSPPPPPESATIPKDGSPGSGSGSGSGSPSYPLASSLKSSTYFDSASARSERKPKSPKKVTFQFEDEDSVPSRSSPPPTKVVWTLGAINDVDEDDYEEEVAEIHQVLVREPDGVLGVAEEQPLEESAVASVAVGSHGLGELPRPHGDELVTPTTIGLPDQDEAAGSSWTARLATSDDETSPSFDDDDEGLFDLDETLPDVPQQTPPHRDFSPLIEAQLVAQALPPDANGFDLPGSLRASYAARVLPPSSVRPHAVDPMAFNRSVDPMAFGRSPVPVQSPSPFSSSLSFVRETARRPIPTTAPIAASSLPSINHWGFPSISASAARQDSTRFRRRSVNKYIPSPPPEEESSGHSTPAAEETIAAAFGSSLPVTITPRLSSLRSPPASTSPPRKPLPTPPPFASGDIGFDELSASPASPRGGSNSEVDSYLRTARFPSASPYRTRFAQELAQQALLDGDDVGESVVGGVDGRTGLDPESFSVRGGRGMMHAHFHSPKTAGHGMGVSWSLAARMKEEEEEEAEERRGGGGWR